MAEPQQALKRIVVHPKLYLGVGKNGRLQHVKPGTEVTLTPVQCKSLGARVRELGQGGTLDVKAQAEAEAVVKAAAAATAAAAAVAKASKSKK